MKTIRLKWHLAFFSPIPNRPYCVLCVIACISEEQDDPQTLSKTFAPGSKQRLAGACKPIPKNHQSELAGEAILGEVINDIQMKNNRKTLLAQGSLPRLQQQQMSIEPRPKKLVTLQQKSSRRGNQVYSVLSSQRKYIQCMECRYSWIGKFKIKNPQYQVKRILVKTQANTCVLVLPVFTMIFRNFTVNTLDYWPAKEHQIKYLLRPLTPCLVIPDKPQPLSKQLHMNF